MPWDSAEEANDGDFKALPKGPYVLEPVKAETQIASTGKLMVNMQTKVSDSCPSGHGNRRIFNLFVLGTSDDPKFEKPESVKGNFNFALLTAILKVADVKLKDTLEETLLGFEFGIAFDANVKIKAGSLKDNGEKYEDKNEIAGIPSAAAGNKAKGVVPSAAPAITKPPVGAPQP